MLLDAFSSDSIPVHLVTREAFEIYKRHLSPQGLIVTHISNRNIEVRPTVASVARSVGLMAADQFGGVTPQLVAQGYAGSRWVVSGTDAAFAANGLPNDKWPAIASERRQALDRRLLESGRGDPLEAPGVQRLKTSRRDGTNIWRREDLCSRHYRDPAAGDTIVIGITIA